MMQWGKLIVQTVQLSGRVVFLRDSAPSSMSQWIDVLPSQVPRILLSQEDLTENKFVTRSEDLVVLLPGQEKLLGSLNQVAGQIWMVGAEPDHAPLVDHVWPRVDFSQWQELSAKISQELQIVEPIAQFKNSFQSGCLFLDRDDVVVVNVPYNKDAAKVILRDGAIELINQAHLKNLWVAIVTNQSGLGRGRIDWFEFQAVHQQMLRLLAAGGAWIDETLWASYIDEKAVPAGEYLPSLRKPRSGMFIEVARKLKVNLQRSYMVGDSASDLVAAYGVGVTNLYLARTEKTEQEVASLKRAHFKGTFQVIENLKDLLPVIG